jgi:transmembrane sensor
MSTDSFSPVVSSELVDRYLAGSCSDAERAQVDAWVEAYSLRGAIDALRARSEEPDFERVARDWARVVERTTAVAARTSRPLPAHAAPARRITVPSGWFRKQGVLAATAGMGVALLLGLGVFGSSRTPSPVRSYATGAGERKTVSLPDGSRVTLAPQTQLVVERGFGDDTRSVSVRGEAFFDVVPVDRVRFTVHLDGATAHVLGTAFDVRRYAGDREARVAVVSGRVAIEHRLAHAGRASVVTAGTVAIITDSGVMVRPSADVSSYAEWRNGRLQFDRAPVSEVLTTVGRWSGYELRLSDSSLASRHLSVTFDRQSATEMLEALRVVLGADLKVEGRVVTFVPRARIAPPAIRRGADMTPFSSEVGR